MVPGFCKPNCSRQSENCSIEWRIDCGMRFWTSNDGKEIIDGKNDEEEVEDFFSVAITCLLKTLLSRLSMEEERRRREKEVRVGRRNGRRGDDDDKIPKIYFQSVAIEILDNQG
jgi:hypothetical protein